MKIEYRMPETFHELTDTQVAQISGLLLQLSSQRTFKWEQLRRAMMFGSLCIAIDAELEKLVGMGLLTYVSTVLYTSATIEDVVVDSGYRGNRIGPTIITNLIAKAKRFPLRIEHIDLTSNPKRIDANKIYRTLGFMQRDTNCYRMILE